MECSDSAAEGWGQSGQGGTGRAIQDYLGHKSIANSVRYTKFSLNGIGPGPVAGVVGNWRRRNLRLVQQAIPALGRRWRSRHDDQ